MIVLEEFDEAIETDSDLTPKGLRTWAAREGLRAQCRKKKDELVVESSGNNGCFGGWDVIFDDITADQYYRIAISFSAGDMESILDGMPVFVFWLDEYGDRVDYDYLLTGEPEEASGRVERVLKAPSDAKQLAIRCGVRWTATGFARFSAPSVQPASQPADRIHRIAVAAGKPQEPETMDDNLQYFLTLARRAGKRNADLLVMPEVILSWHISGDDFDLARPIPGAETDAFADVADDNDMMIAFSMSEADGQLLYNTEVLIGPDGDIIGKYRKTHLAIFEGWKGVTPGDELPVLDTAIGKLAMSICKDSSVLESARVPAMHGAEAMLLSIMGDHRAVDWHEPDQFSPDRWKVIMRARAIENHLWMVVARNNIEGCCIISPSGDIVAYNYGSQRIITADCDLGERLHPWRGASFRDATWAERRPQLYD